MCTLASFRRYILDHMVSLRHPDILEALIAWCLTSVVRSFELLISELTAIISLSGANRGFVRLEAYTILGALFKKKDKKVYEYKIRFESEYLLVSRKEITRRYMFKKKA